MIFDKFDRLTSKKTIKFLAFHLISFEQTLKEPPLQYETVVNRNAKRRMP